MSVQGGVNFGTLPLGHLKVKSCAGCNAQTVPSLLIEGSWPVIMLLLFLLENQPLLRLDGVQVSEWSLRLGTAETSQVKTRTAMVWPLLLQLGRQQCRLEAWPA
mmetsp:Transcript_57346/g.134420  ORF Transcript_57346/g.134420 Transcript_57346/m.134420 type:complete len:104 (-) Transcript_57346:769-1080(-)